jgi:hypothetical protein
MRAPGKSSANLEKPSSCPLAITFGAVSGDDETTVAIGNPDQKGKG